MAKKKITKQKSQVKEVKVEPKEDDKVALLKANPKLRIKR